ncbi:hypothetical protein BKH25_12365 [Actinomyces naeslundii]|nr:hypothetical protein BKH25_12365 [Actinomyces naeslundii]OMG40442.1 hypothetical protein BKH03_09540 [Actinomyces naeslundii]
MVGDVTSAEYALWGIAVLPALSVMLISFLGGTSAVLDLASVLTVLLFSVSATVLALSIIVLTAM